ncbi:LysR family transcriptional regulator [bacterium]|nr:MAG: LysR family transcriptional regulator [bacterium]
MIPMEWYRTFLAIYRAGSVSGAARSLCVTQPAVSQTLAALEGAIGTPLFERSAKGMKPTARGQALYAQIYDSVDRLERVGRSLSPRVSAPVVFRLGVGPEAFHEFALPRLAPLGLSLAVTLGEEREMLGGVESGALDAALTTLKPNPRSLQHRVLGERRYVLIAPSAMVPIEGDVAVGLNALPWVSYSEERPITRRYFSQVLGSRFEARVALVVPDLRSVVRAVELGVGVSIVPDFACRRSLEEGRLREIFPLEIPAERWTLSYREPDTDREDLLAVAAALA